MKPRFYFFICAACCCFSLTCLAQEKAPQKNDTLSQPESEVKTSAKQRREQRRAEKDLYYLNDTLAINIEDIDPNSPARAAFYSAILPGLGQAYNKAYWKIPVVYGALGTSLYFYFTNDDDFNRYRDALKRRLAGFNDDEFQGIILNQTTLERAQREFRRNRDLSLLITVLLYGLNIVEANVHAHLKQFNIRNNLTLRPMMKHDIYTGTVQTGLTLRLNF